MYTTATFTVCNVEQDGARAFCEKKEQVLSTWIQRHNNVLPVGVTVEFKDQPVVVRSSCGATNHTNRKERVCVITFGARMLGRAVKFLVAELLHGTVFDDTSVTVKHHRGVVQKSTQAA